MPKLKQNQGVNVNKPETRANRRVRERRLSDVGLDPEHPGEINLLLKLRIDNLVANAKKRIWNVLKGKALLAPIIDGQGATLMEAGIVDSRKKVAEIPLSLLALVKTEIEAERAITKIVQNVYKRYHWYIDDWTPGKRIKAVGYSGAK